MDSQVPMNLFQSHSCISLGSTLLRISGSSVMHFHDVSCMVVDLPSFSAVRSLTSWYVFAVALSEA